MRRSQRAPLGLFAAAVALLALTAAALAASGILSTGAPVRPTRPLSPTAGVGLPARGGSRLLGLSVPDPSGGLPWGMRIVHTTRDLVCVQIGRLYHGELGVLGLDGAFHDDGRFHPLPPDALGPVIGARFGPRAIVNCQQPIEASSLAVSGIAASAVAGPAGATAATPATERWISYGLLGPRAQSITYRYRGRSHTLATQPDLGAYLVVLPGGSREPARTGASGGGGSSPGGGYLVPRGALTAITYRLGAATCRTTARPVTNSCPEPRASTWPRPPRDLHRRVQVSLRHDGSGQDSAIVTFTAPYRVASARHSYSIVARSPCGRGATATTIERDVKAGEVVHARFNYVFANANACRPTVELQVVYHASPSPPFLAQRGEVIVGETRVKRPE